MRRVFNFIFDWVKLKSIRARISLPIIVMVLLVSLIYGTTTVMVLQSSTNKALETTLTGTASTAASAVSNEIESILSRVNDLYPDYIAVHKGPADEAFFEELAYDGGYSKVGIADEKGISNSGENISGTAYYTRCKETLAPAIGDLNIIDANNMTITFAAPILNGRGEFDGITYAVYNGTLLTNIAGRYSIGKTGNACILDKTGIVIAHPTLSYVFNKDNAIENAKSDSGQISKADVTQKAISGINATSFYTIGGTDMVASYAPIEGTDGWTIVLSADINEFTSSISTSIRNMLFITLGLVALSIIFAFLSSKSLTKRVKVLESAAHQMAEGNLNFTIKNQGHDEITRLASALQQSRDNLMEYIGEIKEGLALLSEGKFSFQTTTDFKGDFYEMKIALDEITDSLKNMISNIRASATKIDETAGQVSGSSQQLSTGTTEQAATIQQLSAAMGEISRKVDQNAKDSKKANLKTRDTQEEIEQCNQDMQSLISAMGHIEKSSGEIHKIIKTIEDIAFQTNILALNAAVEAARAGTAGKGFAVVADEVRNLASKSAEAAKTTTELIEGTVRAVANGNKIVWKTAESLDQAVENVQELTSLIDGIAEATSDQSQAIEQVNVGVGQVSAVVQTNSATAEESAANSEELTMYSESLKAVIRKYA